MTTTTLTLPWRLGNKLHETFHGAVAIYDGTPNGDGARHGRFVAVAFTRDLGSLIVAGVNGYQRGPATDALAVVQAQTEDSALWFRPRTATEAYLQTALRELHAAVDGSAPLGDAAPGAPL